MSAIPRTNYLHLLIGDKGCEFSLISKLMVDNDGKKVLGRHVGSIGKRLGIDNVTINCIKSKFQSNPLEIQCCISELLIHYRSQKADNAKLELVLKALSQLKLKKIKTAIESYYLKPEVLVPRKRKRNPEERNLLGDAIEKKNGDDTIISIKDNVEGGHRREIESIVYKMYLCMFAFVILFVIAFSIYSLVNSIAGSRVSKQQNNVVGYDDESKAQTINLPHDNNYVNVSNFKQYEQISKNDSNCCAALNISVRHSSDWKQGQLLGRERLLKRVVFSGPIEIAALFYILLQTVSLNELKVYNTDNLFCQQNGSRLFPQFIKKVKLNSLHTMELTDFTSCESAYNMIVNYISMSNVVHIKILHGQVTDFNVDDIRKLFQVTSASLEYIELSLESDTSQLIFDSKFNYPKVRKVKYDSTRDKVNRQKFWPILGEYFSDSFANLEYFDSQRGINYTDLISVLKCGQIKEINSTVYLTNTETFWNMNAAYKGNNLKSVELTFIFLKNRCPDQQDIWRFGVTGFSVRIKSIKIISNCIVDHQMLKSTSYLGTGLYIFHKTIKNS